MKILPGAFPLAAGVWRFWGPEGHLGDLETAYRARHLRSDVRQMRWAIAIYCAILLAFSALDGSLVRLEPVSLQVLALRLVVVALLLGVGLRLARSRHPAAIDRLALWTALLAVVTTLAINTTRPLDYTHFATIDAVFVFALWTMLPLAAHRRALPPLLATAGDLALLAFVKEDLPGPAMAATVLGLCAANLLGLAVSARIYGYRREQYLVHLELERLASRDPLTGLLNRRSLIDRAEEALRRQRVIGDPLTLVLLDLDHFKTVNDRFGHAAGDEALRAFGALLGEGRREGDLVGRLGGEEFVLVLPSTSLEGGLTTAERIRRALHRRPIDGTSETARVTVSAGAAQARRSDVTLETVLLRADRALYRAKQLGRDRVEPEDSADAERDLKAERTA